MQKKSAYDELANEYYHESHITSRNFDKITEYYFEDNPFKISEKGMVLEIGAGRGRTNEFLSIDCERVVQVDNSVSMLRVEPRENPLLRILSDATDLPFLDKQFSTVTSFLCDPFWGLNFLSEVYRVLESDGVFIFTLPSYQWGKGLRNKIGLDINETRFKTEHGETVVVPSVIVPVEQIVNMLVHVGFVKREIEIVPLPLHPKIKKVSPDIIESANTQDIDVHELVIINVCYAKKID